MPVLICSLTSVLKEHMEAKQLNYCVLVFFSGEHANSIIKYTVTMDLCEKRISVVADIGLEILEQFLEFLSCYLIHFSNSRCVGLFLMKAILKEVG